MKCPKCGYHRKERVGKIPDRFKMTKAEAEALGLTLPVINGTDADIFNSKTYESFVNDGIEFAVVSTGKKKDRKYTYTLYRSPRGLRWHPDTLMSKRYIGLTA